MKETNKGKKEGERKARMETGREKVCLRKGEDKRQLISAFS